MCNLPIFRITISNQVIFEYTKKEMGNFAFTQRHFDVKIPSKLLELFHSANLIILSNVLKQFYFLTRARFFALPTNLSRLIRNK